MVRMTATAVARSFSAVLNRVAEGDEIEITRNGQTIATLSPARRHFLSAAELRELMESLPPVDDEFAGDVMAARRSLAPPESHWPS